MEEKTKVTILTSTYRIKGHIDLLPGSRVTDFMAEARDFIAVTNAEVWELQVGGRQVLAAPFINVSRDHIEIILPGHCKGVRTLFRKKGPDRVLTPFLSV